MDIDWLLKLISLPLLIIPTLAIIMNYCLNQLHSISVRKKIIKDSLLLFDSLLEYDIGAPDLDEINKLQNALEEKIHFLEPMLYQQMTLGYKKVQKLYPLLRRQKDNRDNDAILQLKQELEVVIESIK